MKKPRIGGAVYILPNLLTTGNLFWGFFSIMKALQGQFGWAASAILLAAVFDMLDGRVARLTKGTSEFGVQYDSLCDLVSFGCAPAILMYHYGLNEFGRIGWILCFVFMACGALRLARFNVMSGIGKASGDFTGLPIPMAAAVIATFVAFIVDMQTGNAKELLPERVYTTLVSAELRQTFLLVAAPVLSFLMVSNVVYRSHKSLKITAIKPFKLLALLTVLVALIGYQPETVGFTLCFAYALSGLVEWAFGWKKPTEEDDIFGPQDDDEDSAENGDTAKPADSGVHALPVRNKENGKT